MSLYFDGYASNGNATTQYAMASTTNFQQPRMVILRERLMNVTVSPEGII